MKSKTEQLRDEFNAKLEKEKKIKQEINRVKKLYVDFTKEKTKTLEGLISEAAFMKISLEELREDLLSNGLTEMFEQGSQRFERERPQVKIYTTFIQRYSNTMKQLIDLIPGEEKKEEKDELLEFLNRSKIKK
ncbi:hypothetical protein [Romboutsia sp.]|uniref:hypothetical protein n=1 Tax=Romboutsia sp. TaxID=1965302 RepID=UPI002C43E997|nr:hypothetical protein [Romboutsia sp.]HSQ90013.1 hypothetical protein [Romboutsia sp.]